MAEPRYRSGQNVQLIPTVYNRTAATGPYEVEHQLPHASGEFHYRICSAQERWKRVVGESELQAWKQAD